MVSSKKIDEGKIYIGRLKKDVTREMVLDHFAQYGSVKAVDIINKRHSYGFVTFCEPSVVNTVLDQDHHTINGKSVIVEKALTREQKGSSMADTRCIEDKLRALGRAEQHFSSSCEGTSMAIHQGGVGTGEQLSTTRPTYSAVVAAAQWNSLQTPNSHMFASSGSSENAGHRASCSGGGVVSATTDQPPKGSSANIVSVSMDQLPSGSGAIVSASMYQHPIGSLGLNINGSSADGYGTNGGESSKVPICASGMYGPIARPKVIIANRNSGGGIGEERSYNNITGTTSSHSDATWRRSTESSQLVVAGYETKNVATFPGSSSSGGGGVSASIADQLSRDSPYEQYESWQSFDTNSGGHDGTCGGGSQGTYGWQAATLDSNRFVQQQTSAVNYPKTFVGDYLGSAGGYGLNDPQNAPGSSSGGGGVSAVVTGQPPIRSNMYGIGRHDYFNTSSNSGRYPFACTEEAQRRQSAAAAAAAGGGGASWGVQQGAGSGYSTTRGMGNYIMEPSDPNAALMNDSSQAADYGHNNIGGMDHNIMMPSGPPSRNVWTNDSLQATASYEGGDVADHATTRHNNNEQL